MSRQAQILLAAFVALLLLVGGGFYYVYFYQPSGSAAPAAQTAFSAPSEAPAAEAPKPQASGKQPDPVILAMDRAAIRRSSKVGQDIARQLQVFADQARRDLTAQQDRLQKDGEAFQQASAGLTAEQRAARATDLDKRQAALQTAAQRKEAQLGASGQAAFAAVDKVMGPVLQDIIKARGANLVLDRASLPYVQTGLDITPELIAQLDAKMSSYKVTLAPAP